MYLRPRYSYRIYVAYDRDIHILRYPYAYIYVLREIFMPPWFPKPPTLGRLHRPRASIPPNRHQLRNPPWPCNPRRHSLAVPGNIGAQRRPQWPAWSRPPMKNHGRTLPALRRGVPSFPLSDLPLLGPGGHPLPTTTTATALHIADVVAAVVPSFIFQIHPWGIFHPPSR